MLIFRFHEKHKIVNNILRVLNKSFYECSVQLFNDIATKAIHLIYKVRTIIIMY